LEGARRVRPGQSGERHFTTKRTKGTKDNTKKRRIALRAKRRILLFVPNFVAFVSFVVDPFLSFAVTG
jgi:hypothetical protein